MTPVFPCVLDHLVIGARSLEEGRSFVADLLGVSPVAGGTHPHMGTHNVLLSLGGSVYLEVIAVDPEAEPPDRPRWFSLDNPNILQVLKQGPRLLTWVARTPRISQAWFISPLMRPVRSARCRAVTSGGCLLSPRTASVLVAVCYRM